MTDVAPLPPARRRALLTAIASILLGWPAFGAWATPAAGLAIGLVHPTAPGSRSEAFGDAQLVIVLFVSYAAYGVIVRLPTDVLAEIASLRLNDFVAAAKLDFLGSGPAQQAFAFDLAAGVGALAAAIALGRSARPYGAIDRFGRRVRPARTLLASSVMVLLCLVNDFLAKILDPSMVEGRLAGHYVLQPLGAFFGFMSGMLAGVAPRIGRGVTPPPSPPPR
jgi:hypothetical protein